MPPKSYAPPKPAHIIKFSEFKARFTDQEWAGVKQAAAADVASFIEWATLAAEQGVHLKGDATGAFMTALVNAEVLTAERRAEILA